jgi:hypothetical protein
VVRGTWCTDPVRVILVRDTRRTSDPTSDYGLALVTTDLDDTSEVAIARYAACWSVEVTFFDVSRTFSASDKPATESVKPSSGPFPSDFFGIPTPVIL